MAHVMEQDEVSNVVYIRLFGFEAEMPEPNGLANLVKQTRRLRLGHGYTLDKILSEGVIPQN
jgi:hypothetical protein